MQNQLKPEAIIANTTANMLGTLEKLPRIIDQVDMATAEMARGGLRLHQETAMELRGDSSGGTPRHRPPAWALWMIVVGLLALLILG